MATESNDNGKPTCCAPGVLTICKIATVEEQRMAEMKANLPVGKHTVLDLYVTAKEAFAKWQDAPEQIKIIDVRTPEEHIYVGHPEMAWKIPLLAQTYVWDSAKACFPMKPLEDFVARVKEVAEPEDMLMLMCRSGGRSAMAINILAANGFKNVYNIYDGMEGDKVDDSLSVFNGMPMRNGWKNSGLPWTYTINPDKLKYP
jgi:rhodanese-related sulfurtransferase